MDCLHGEKFIKQEYGKADYQIDSFKTVRWQELHMRWKEIRTCAVCV